MSETCEYLVDNDILYLIGELGVYQAQDMKRVLLEFRGETGALTLDLSGVTRIDSAGVQLLAALKSWFGHSGRELRVVAHSDVVAHTFELCNLAGFFGDPMVLTSPRAKVRAQGACK